MRRAVVLCLATVIGFVVAAAPASASTVTVQVGPNGSLVFSPANATVHVGDTVQWVWGSSNHSTTSGTNGSPDGKWNSAVQNKPFTFSFKFTRAGTFHYFCEVHFSLGMVGSITVLPAVPQLYVASNGSNSVSEFGSGASGNTPPLGTLAGANTGLSGPFGLTDNAAGQLTVANGTNSSLGTFAPGVFGNTAPTSTIAGSATALSEPEGMAIDGTGRQYVVDHSTNAVTEYKAGTSGNHAPARTISGAATGLNGPTGIARSNAGDVFVTNTSANSVTEYGPTASGNAAPIATLSGASTGLNAPTGVTVGPGNFLFVANSGSSTIAEYRPGANGNVAPVATISGTATGLSQPWGLASDISGDLLVANRLANSVTEYLPGSKGDASPFATLSGASTALSAPTFLALATPSAVTDPATGVTASSATLEGTVNPNGAPTHYEFDYGTTTAYGSHTAAVNVGGGGTAVSASAMISSLKSATTYHFRVVAISNAGTRLGADQTFTTT